MKKNLVPLLLLAGAVGGNIYLGYLAYRSLYQPTGTWIGFVLVWLNILLGSLTFRRQRPISYLFLTACYIIELLSLVNIFWVTTRVV